MKRLRKMHDRKSILRDFRRTFLVICIGIIAITLVLNVDFDKKTEIAEQRLDQSRHSIAQIFFITPWVCRQNAFDNRTGEIWPGAALTRDQAVKKLERPDRGKFKFN